MCQYSPNDDSQSPDSSPSLQNQKSGQTDSGMFPSIPFEICILLYGKMFVKLERELGDREVAVGYTLIHQRGCCIIVCGSRIGGRIGGGQDWGQLVPTYHFIS